MKQKQRRGIILKFPRVSLPRQTGGVHKVKTKVNPRKAKYKEKIDDFYHD